MGMKIHIITGRRFSNYRYEFHIIAVFKKRKNAKEFFKRFKDVKIEEFEFIDDKFPAIDQLMKKRVFFIKMDRKGNIDYINENNEYSWFVKALKKDMGFISKQKMFYIYVFADDKKHAIEITNEKRIQLMVENKWSEKMDIKQTT